MWWLILALGGLLIAWSFWRAHTHPAQILARQGANMNWLASRTITDQSGLRNVCLKRDGQEVMINYEPAQVVLLTGNAPQTFADFIALERWLATSAPPSDEHLAANRAQLQDSGIAAPDPMREFERAMRAWPASQAQLALEVLSAGLIGDQQTFTRVHGDLTVDQLRTVVQTMMRIHGVTSGKHQG